MVLSIYWIIIIRRTAANCWLNSPLRLSITNWSFGQDRSWQFSHHPQPSHASQHISASNERPNVNSSPYRQNQKSYLSDRYNFGLEELTLIQWHMKNLLLHQFSKLYIPNLYKEETTLKVYFSLHVSSSKINQSTLLVDIQLSSTWTLRGKDLC